MTQRPPSRAMALREPAHRVSVRAPAYWRVQAALGAAVAWVLAAIAGSLAAATTHGWWTPLLWIVAVVLVLAPIAALTIAPTIRYRVHRWEVTALAVHVRYGWITRTDEIVPLSRVQTVDSTVGPLMRAFGLRTVTVQTASGHGTVAIAGLDDAVAQEVVAHLVAITSASAGDAT